MHHTDTPLRSVRMRVNAPHSSSLRMRSAAPKSILHRNFNSIFGYSFVSTPQKTLFASSAENTPQLPGDFHLVELSVSIPSTLVRIACGQCVCSRGT